MCEVRHNITGKAVNYALRRSWLAVWTLLMVDFFPPIN